MCVCVCVCVLLGFVIIVTDRAVSDGPTKKSASPNFPGIDPSFELRAWYNPGDARLDTRFITPQKNISVPSLELYMHFTWCLHYLTLCLFPSTEQRGEQ